MHQGRESSAALDAQSDDRRQQFAAFFHSLLEGRRTATVLLKCERLQDRLCPRELHLKRDVFGQLECGWLDQSAGSEEEDCKEGEGRIAL